MMEVPPIPDGALHPREYVLSRAALGLTHQKVPVIAQQWLGIFPKQMSHVSPDKYRETWEKNGPNKWARMSWKNLI